MRWYILKKAARMQEEHECVVFERERERDLPTNCLHDTHTHKQAQKTHEKPRSNVMPRSRLSLDLSSAAVDSMVDSVLTKEVLPEST